MSRRYLPPPNTFAEATHVTPLSTQSRNLTASTIEDNSRPKHPVILEICWTLFWFFLRKKKTCFNTQIKLKNVTRHHSCRLVDVLYYEGCELFSFTSFRFYPIYLLQITLLYDSFLTAETKCIPRNERLDTLWVSVCMESWVKSNKKLWNPTCAQSTLCSFWVLPERYFRSRTERKPPQLPGPDSW